MCQLCREVKVVSIPLGTYGMRFMPCPICNTPELPMDHPDYHPGQSMAEQMEGQNIAG